MMMMMMMKTHTAGNQLRTGPQPGGCRSLIYNNVVSRYFSKMLFAEKPGKFFAFALLSLCKKVTEISSKTVYKVTTVPKTVHFLKVSTVPITVLKKYRGTAQLCLLLRLLLCHNLESQIFFK